MIKTIKVGMLDTNCYLITEGKKSVIIDPGDNAEKILSELEKNKLEAIILTHLHFDHILAVQKIKEKTRAKIVYHKKDLEILEKGSFLLDEKDLFLENDGRIPLEEHGFFLDAIHSPGHSPGSICIYDSKNKVLFSGDTIFKGAVGATHFRGGSFKEIKKSIKNNIFRVFDDIDVYPGHGDKFNLAHYKKEIADILGD